MRAALLLTGLVLIAVVTAGAPVAKRKPCRRLCTHDVATCVGSCRMAVAGCRQTGCADVAPDTRQRCRRACRRRCRRECRGPILEACRVDAEPTRCRAPDTTTTTTSTTTSTLPAKTDWAT